jgi:hypothetical protein
VLDESPVPVLRRLMIWLTPFKACFGHRAQAISLGPQSLRVAYRRGAFGRLGSAFNSIGVSYAYRWGGGL